MKLRYGMERTAQPTPRPYSVFLKHCMGRRDGCGGKAFRWRAQAALNKEWKESSDGMGVLL